MQPRRARARPTRMVRTLLAALAASLALAGCGSEDADETASDPAARDSPATGTSGTPDPGAPPTVGTYPEFGPEDYTYLLAVSCLCPDANTPIRVTVVDDEVTEAVYAGGGRGVLEGGAAPARRRLTLDDVIAAANDTEASRVDVDWPEGQDYPSSVYVDTDSRTADAGVGYHVSDVVVG